MQKNISNDSKSDNETKFYPPVVSVLGHVDHGKTTLLDTLRKSDIASSEKGGITQKIGASQISAIFEGQKRNITFIDTPGHEAFSNMRSYGSIASDIALLVVASDDGVKPQTVESIKILNEAGIPYIVVFTKKDSPSGNVEKVKQQLIKEGVLLEGLGGDIPYINVSAKTNEGIKDLIDLIFLVYDMKHIIKSESNAFLGVVIESKLDKRQGSLSSIIVKQGSLKIGDVLYQSDEIGKVKALFDTHGKNIKNVDPGDAAEILGINQIIQTGSLIHIQKQENKTPMINQPKTLSMPTPQEILKLLTLKIEEELPIILKTEGKGELEAIKNVLPEKVKIVYEGWGDIVFSDVLLAKDMGAIVIGFNVGITKDAKTLAESEKVFYKLFSIIYELLDEIEEVIKSLTVKKEEKLSGKATVLARFIIGDNQVMGVKVTEGKFKPADKIRLISKDIVRGEALITSLKKEKKDAKEVVRGEECGMLLSPSLDFQVGDVIIAYNDLRR